MFTTKLGPFEQRLAEILARRRGVSVDDLISHLLRDDAAMELIESSAQQKVDSRPIDCPELAAAAH